MTVEEALACFEKAGVKRDKRTIERYCEHSKLDARKVEGAYGLTWRLDPESVDGKIKKLLAMSEESAEPVGTTTHDKEVRQPTTSDDMPRHVAASPDMSGPVAATKPPVSPVVAPSEDIIKVLEENTKLKQENVDLRINNRDLVQTNKVLVEESRESAKERRALMQERQTFMAQIGEMTTRFAQLVSGRTPPMQGDVEIIKPRVVDADMPPTGSAGSSAEIGDNSSSEIIG